MKPDLTHLDKFRTVRGPQESPLGAPYGLFHFRTGTLGNDRLRVIACAAGEEGDPNHGWDHVSVSAWMMPKKKGQPARPRTPTWDDDEPVIQFHPPEELKVNHAPNCLHLWKCTNAAFPLPPPLLVGPPTIIDPERQPINGASVTPDQPGTGNREPGTTNPTRH